MAGRVIGIDLGTSNSVVTTMVGGDPVVIPSREGLRIVPSVVSFLPDGHVVVGQKAKNRRLIDPLNTVYSVKRLIGRPWWAAEVKEFMAHYPFRIEKGEDENPKIIAHGRRYSVEEVQAIILRKLKKDAEAYLGEEVTDLVVTVPANFNEAQRYGTKIAGELSGLNVLRILNEPTAAALAYGFGQGMRETVAVYDFGGGTFDITILELRDSVFEVMATAGNTYLGGDDFDDRLVRHMVSKFKDDFGYDLSTELVAIQRLKAVAERLKCELTEREHVEVSLKEMIPGSSDPVDFTYTIDRASFDDLCRDIVEMTFAVCDEALRLAGVTASQVGHLVLVGGSTRVPLVYRMVEQYFDKQPEHHVDVHEVVAVGAAIHAGGLSDQFYGQQVGYQDENQPEPALLIDVTPHSLGVGTVGEIYDVLIERNTNIPVERTRRFTTSADDQSTVRLEIFEGESRNTADNSKLGELLLEGIVPAPRGEVEVDVTFHINTDGMLEVKAFDPATGLAQSCQLSISGGLSDAQVEELMFRQEDEELDFSE